MLIPRKCIIHDKACMRSQVLHIERFVYVETDLQYFISPSLNFNFINIVQNVQLRRLDVTALDLMVS